MPSSPPAKFSRSRLFPYLQSRVVKELHCKHAIPQEVLYDLSRVHWELSATGLVEAIPSTPVIYGLDYTDAISLLYLEPPSCEDEDAARRIDTALQGNRPVRFRRLSTAVMDLAFYFEKMKL